MSRFENALPFKTAELAMVIPFNFNTKKLKKFQSVHKIFMQESRMALKWMLGCEKYYLFSFIFMKRLNEPTYV